MSEMKVKVDGGKYEFFCPGDGSVGIRRHGEDWIPELSWGGKAIVALVHEHAAALEELEKLKVRHDA